MVFTYCKGQLIGYGNFKLTGVDRYGNENKFPPKNVNENDLDHKEYQEYFHPDQEYQTNKQPVKVKLELLQKGTTRISKMLEIMAPNKVQEYMQQERPNEIP